MKRVLLGLLKLVKVLLTIALALAFVICLQNVIHFSRSGRIPTVGINMVLIAVMAYTVWALWQSDRRHKIGAGLFWFGVLGGELASGNPTGSLVLLTLPSPTIIFLELLATRTRSNNEQERNIHTYP